jgi:class 3 adenylate cyclase
VLAEVEEFVDAEPLGEIELKGFGKPVKAFVVSSLVPVAARSEA